MFIKLFYLTILNGIFHSAHSSINSQLPCPRIEYVTENGTRRISDVDGFFPFVTEMMKHKMEGVYLHLYGDEGDEPSSVYYIRCDKSEIHLTLSDLAEVTNKLLMEKEAGRSLFHFAINNCPNFEGDMKQFQLKSQIQLCYFPPESI
ncbi:GSCOCG00007192001-RA-CDS [Cotesia congregata]|uniref:Uncharacterized protein n=1 Tax=Cotesia congregata TaxID=51543 RepID=A0A8J2MHQ7_COTCN|nr:GSCOCG00007192001-RA-CDS [Cotesia congregata]CAG5092771.1 Protein of unknown function [Cotesia congregata]